MNALHCQIHKHSSTALLQVYSSSAITLTMVGTSELTASAAFSGVLRAAAVTSQSAQTVLDAYAGVYASAGAVSHSVSVRPHQHPVFVRLPSSEDCWHCITQRASYAGPELRVELLLPEGETGSPCQHAKMQRCCAFGDQHRSPDPWAQQISGWPVPKSANVRRCPATRRPFASSSRRRR